MVTVAHHTFTSYIAGQCTEAVILGSLCTVGMLIFRFPYAPMVGALVGATALLPIIGAYIGAIVGAFMILTVSPGTGDPVYLFSGDPAAAGREPDLSESGRRFGGTSGNVDPGSCHGRRRALGNPGHADRSAHDGNGLQTVL